MNLKQMKIILFTALWGCLIVYAGDVLLLGAPMSGATYFSVYKGTMANINFSRLIWGNSLGILIILQLPGYFVVYYLLKKDHKVLSGVFLLSLTISMLCGMAYHSTFAFYGSALKVHQHIQSSETSLMMKHFLQYQNIFYYGMGALFGFGSFAYGVLILWKKTVFSRWFALLNPLFILFAVRGLLKLIPAPLGGYMAPGYGNITAFIFFSVILISLYKREF